MGIEEQSVVTEKANLYIKFEKGETKKSGKESVYLEDLPLIKKELENKLNKIRKEKIEHKKNQENNHYIKYEPDLLTKWNFNIADDGDEMRSTENTHGVVGTTLVNFLNKTDNIVVILNEFSEKMENYNMDIIKEKQKEIISIINQYKNKCIEEEFIMQLSADDYFEYNEDTIIKEFVHKVYELEDKYVTKENLYQLTLNILMKTYNEPALYLRNMICNIKCFESAFIEDLNMPLTFIIRDVFKCFYDDLYFIEFNKKNLYTFFKQLPTKIENHKYNTYYKEVYKYMLEIENMDTTDSNNRFKKFSFNKLCTIFINTLRIDILNMLENYDTSKIKINEIEVKNVNNTAIYEISSLNELFYYSQYHIKEDGRGLQYCNLCGRFFITDFRKSETHCRRKYKIIDSKIFTCCDIVNFNSNKGYGKDRQIDSMLSKIKLNLVKKDLENKSYEYEKFKSEFRKYLRSKYPKSANINYDETIKWLNNYL